METVTDNIFLDSKITADGDCSHEIKRRLLLGRKTVTNLDSILKIRDIILPTKVHLVKAMVFPIVMYGCLNHKEGWASKNWCFWTVVLEKTLESSLDCKEIQPVNPKGNQFWIFIASTDAEAECQYFSHLMRRANSFEKTLMLGGVGGRRRRRRQRMRWWDGITNLMGMSLSKVKDRETWHTAVRRDTESQTWVNSWTTTRNYRWPKGTWTCAQHL